MTALALGDSPAYRPEFVRFLPSKWRSSALALTLEAEGLLVRISSFNMDIGKALPACRTTAARMLGIHRNKLDKVLKVLLEAGEIVADASGIYSPRALNEFHRAVTEMARRGKKTRAALAAGQMPLDLQLDHTPEQPHGNPEDTPPVRSEKTEQILRASEKRRDEEESQGRKIDTTEHRPVESVERSGKGPGRPAPMSEFLRGVKGADAILVTVREVTKDAADAEDWLEAEITDSGQAAVRAAHRMLCEKRRSGARIRSPLAWMSKTAATLAANARAAAEAPKATDFAEQLRALRAKTDAATRAREAAHA